MATEEQEEKDHSRHETSDGKGFDTDVAIPDRFNAVTMLVDDHVREGKGDRVAIEFGDQRITYSELLKYTNKMGNSLLDLGVEIENRVGVLLPDMPQWFYSYLGAMKIGAVPIAINTILTPKTYEYILGDSRAKVLITTPELYSMVRPVSGHLKHLKNIIIVGDIEQPGDMIIYDDLMEDASDRLGHEDTSSQDVALWLYSSGSTGPPKGTIHLHRDIKFTTDLYAKNILNMNKHSKCFSASKLFFAYGLGNTVHFPFRFGGTSIIFPGRPKPKAIYEVIDKHKPTHFFGVPTLYASMLAFEDMDNYDLSSLEYCISAGEALQPVIFENWKKATGLEIMEGIGSTELLHIFISNREGKIKPGSSGLEVPGYEARVVDEEGNELPPNEEGNLIVKGESSAPYYWNKLEKTKKTMVGEWLHTGDVYYKDEDDFFWYAGRSDDMLKVGGIWVSPIEVENALMEHDAVFEAAVIGAPDKEGLIKPKAYVKLKEGFEPGDELVKDIQMYVKGTIEPYKYPRMVEFVKELPKTATGKIQRFKLRNENR